MIRPRLAILLAVALPALTVLPARALAQVTLAQPLNNATSSLAQAHTVGSGTLVLQSGHGSRFGTPSVDAPIRVTVARQSTLIGGQIVASTARTIFLVTARSVDTLSGLTAVEGTSDQAFSKNDPVAVVITAGDIADIHTAIEALPVDANVVHKTAVNETVAGIKTFSSPIVGSVTGTAATITGNVTQGQVTGLATDLAAKANDSAVVHLALPETITGAKTFAATITGNVSGTAATITGSVGQGQVTNLTTDLAAKAADAAVVHKTGNETIAGTKTFSAATVVGEGAAQTVAGGLTVSQPVGTDGTAVVIQKPFGATGNRILKVLTPYDDDMPPFYITDAGAIGMGVELLVSGRHTGHGTPEVEFLPPCDIPLAIGVCPDVRAGIIVRAANVARCLTFISLSDDSHYNFAVEGSNGAVLMGDTTTLAGDGLPDLDVALRWVAADHVESPGTFSAGVLQSESVKVPTDATHYGRIGRAASQNALSLYNTALASATSTSAVLFNGTTQYGTFAPIGLVGNTFSLSFWTKPTASGALQCLFGFTGCEILRNHPNAGDLTFWDGSARLSVTFPSSGSWHHIGVVSNGTNILFYIDGVEAGTAVYVPTVADSDWHVAKRSSGLNYSGEINDVAVWDVGLDGAAMAALAAKSQPPSADLLGRWVMSEGSGTTVADNSGNNHPMTLFGAPTWTVAPAGAPYQALGESVILRASDGPVVALGAAGSAVQVPGTFAVGGGAPLAKLLSATATLNFGEIAAGGQLELTIPVTGAVAGDAVHLGPPAGIESGLAVFGRVSAADTVTVRALNVTGAPIDPASASFRAVVEQFQ